MSVGARLRAVRARRGLTLSDVAGDELSVGLVSKLERDLVNPSLQTLQYLARRLGVRPADLLREAQDTAHISARGALDAARARLLLGDPAEAATVARRAVSALVAAAADGSTGSELLALRARLLAVAAEASIAGGQIGPAAIDLRDASALVAAGVDNSGVAHSGGGDPIAGASVADVTFDAGAAAQAELAWVLGALERRRGALADAQRTWTRCVASLEERRFADAHSPWWEYLRASVLAELGGVAEAQGDAERARNLVARAASIAAGVAQAVGAATALLDAWPGEGAAQPERSFDEPPAAPHAALALAVVAAADRLGRRLTQEAARLERAAWAPGARAPDLAVTRGLR